MLGFMIITLIFICGWRCSPRLYTKAPWFPDAARQQAATAELNAFAVEWERVKKEYRP